MFPAHSLGMLFHWEQYFFIHLSVPHSLLYLPKTLRSYTHYIHAENILDESKTIYFPFCIEQEKTQEFVGSLETWELSDHLSERCPKCLLPFSIFPDNIKAHRDLKSSLLLNHVLFTAQSLNKNKRPERKAFKSSALVPCLWAYNHKAPKNRNTNLRSLNRSLAEQRLSSPLLFGQNLGIFILISLSFV